MNWLFSAFPNIYYIDQSDPICRAPSSWLGDFGILRVQSIVNFVYGTFLNCRRNSVPGGSPCRQLCELATAVCKMVRRWQGVTDWKRNFVLHNRKRITHNRGYTSSYFPITNAILTGCRRVVWFVDKRLCDVNSTLQVILQSNTFQCHSHNYTDSLQLMQLKWSSVFP